MVLEQAALTHDIERIFRSKKLFKISKRRRRHAAHGSTDITSSLDICEGGLIPRRHKGVAHSRHKIWLTQEADAKSWSSLKHVQPKEGRKELAPREIKFRYRRLDTAIRERAGSSQERRKRAKDTPGYYSLFLFSLHS